MKASLTHSLPVYSGMTEPGYFVYHYSGITILLLRRCTIASRVCHPPHSRLAAAMHLLHCKQSKPPNKAGFCGQAVLSLRRHALKRLGKGRKLRIRGFILVKGGGRALQALPIVDVAVARGRHDDVMSRLRRLHAPGHTLPRQHHTPCRLCRAC